MRIRIAAPRRGPVARMVDGILAVYVLYRLIMFFGAPIWTWESYLGLAVTLLIAGLMVYSWVPATRRAAQRDSVAAQLSREARQRIQEG